MNEWMNEPMKNLWTSERVNVWTTESMIERSNQWINEPINESMDSGINERANEWSESREKGTNERMNEFLLLLLFWATNSLSQVFSKPPLHGGTSSQLFLLWPAPAPTTLSQLHLLSVNYFLGSFCNPIRLHAAITMRFAPSSCNSEKAQERHYAQKLPFLQLLQYV